ncbi:DNA repair protein RecO [Candidatus Cyanaurora vandensis]|uniref:DNA repair protein RecO n=1 Tax=Candidatus Cyanaurora vandensis TaxID=2714958 RepID=UPI00257A92C2|nr:DNA repair protein RecO [Candidatus Cyanaurora vandensis]
MSRYYRATGINLKRQPLGEADLLLTIFTREQGLLKAVAKGARKARAKMGGRLDLFVVNDLQLYSGRSLDQVVQAETLHSFNRLSRDLGRLGSAQYWAEAVLAEAVPGQGHPELFDLFLEHLGRLESCATPEIMAQLVHGLYQFLQVSGVAPVVDYCTSTGRVLSQEAAGFSLPLGGLVATECLSDLTQTQPVTQEQVNALQWLPQPVLPPELLVHPIWSDVERLLRRYLEFYLQRSVRSADLLAVCLA